MTYSPTKLNTKDRFYSQWYTNAEKKSQFIFTKCKILSLFKMILVMITTLSYLKCVFFNPNDIPNFYLNTVYLLSKLYHLNSKLWNSDLNSIHNRPWSTFKNILLTCVGLQPLTWYCLTNEVILQQTRWFLWHFNRRQRSLLPCVHNLADGVSI